MLSLLHMFSVILKKRFILILLLTFSTQLLSQEYRAIQLDMEAEALEAKGETKSAEEKRSRARVIRKRNFAHEPVPTNRVGDSEPKLPHPFTHGNKAFFGGFWEIGFRENLPRAFLHSGMDWSMNNGNVTVQHGSPYMPRSVIPYQNESVLPFIVEKGYVTPKEVYLPTLQLNFINHNKKWGFEYSNLPVYGSYDHMAYGFDNQYARYNTRFQMYDHRFMFKIHEELDQERWFTWDFGMRLGGWQTDSSYLSPTLNQAGDLKEDVRFLAPSAGFRFYQTVITNGRIEFGSDLFYTGLASLQYERRFSKDGLFDLGGNYISGTQSYKIESAKPLEMRISGIDLNLIYSFVLMDFHRFSIGAKSTSYAWSANESRAPNFTGSSSEALGLGIMNWYTTSAFYEADGQGKREYRYFSVVNYFIGYSYVF